MKRFCLIILTISVSILCITCSGSVPATSVAAYTLPEYFTKLPFGFYSHWLQPWRAYLETVPAALFLDGVGINFNVNDTINPDLIATMLAKHGVRRARVEIGWGEFNYEDESRLNKEAKFRDRLLALQKQGIRPLILLNANQGVPVPAKLFERTLIVSANAGATQLELENVNDIVPGNSGISDLTGYWAAEALVTDIKGNTVTLSKPLSKPLDKAKRVLITTLKYRPFSPPDTADYRATIAAWQRYVGIVATFVADVLGTTQSDDRGFDMEIWNELTFGSNFLYINKYYDPKLYNYPEETVWENIVAATATYVEEHPEQFRKVLFSNGFANTIPWIASSKQPKQISAISKHPYANRKNYPADEDKNTPVNANFEPYDKSRFKPRYTAAFPEYYATALQTETIVRDMGPITLDIYGTNHGRYAREIQGEVIPAPIWITEVNMSPIEFDPNITSERSLATKAKTTLRYFCFFLNKGVTQLYLYGVAGDDREDKNLNIVKQSFLDYAEQAGKEYPVNDVSYTSPALVALQQVVAKMSEELDPKLSKPRQLEVVAIIDTHDHYQFQGNSTAAFPTLYNRDVFAFLPYQVNPHRFVIPYYVMTRDVMQDLPPEQFTLRIKGLKGKGTTVVAYDPIKNSDVSVEVQERGVDTILLNVTAGDYPYLLIVQEEK